MLNRFHNTEDDVSSRHDDEDGAGISTEYKGAVEYQIHIADPIRIFGGIFFSCWLIYAAYMIIFSHKDGLASYIAAYGFLVFGLLFIVHALCTFVRSKFIVRDTTITRYFAFFPPKTYNINKITKVVIHSARGNSYRVYIGKKKVFTLDDTMINLNLFLTTLENNHVQFKSSII